jgi:hypothetical protein
VSDPQPVSETQLQLWSATQSQPESITHGQLPGTQLQVHTAPEGSGQKQAAV